MKKLLILPFLLIALQANAADITINTLPSTTSVQTTDVFPVVINPSSSNPVTKKSTIGNILKNANVTIAGTANEISSSTGQQDLTVARTWTLSLPESVNMGGKNLELPNGTALVTADCNEASEAGRIFVDTDATSGRQFYYCEGAAGWVSSGGVGALTASKWCKADGTGSEIVCDQDDPSGGAGNVSAIGDCAGGACGDGTSDGGTWIKFYDSDGTGQIITGDITASRVWTLPDATGTVALTTSNVSTATTAAALTANGANCSTGQAPLGVNASGAAEGCYAVLTQGNIDTSAEMLSILTDETGTGVAVFNTAPTFSGLVTAGSFAGDGSALTGLATSFTNSAGLAALMSDETGTLLSVFSDSPAFTTVITLPNGSAPTVDAVGEAAFDDNLYATNYGAMVLYNGTASTGLVGVDVSDAPTNGQVPKFNTGGQITWEDDDDSASVTIADTLMAYALSANTLGGEAGFSYDDATNTLTVDTVATAATASPTISWKDSDATAGDVNAQIVVACTDVGDGTEDCDITISNQVAGAMTAAITMDADGNTTIANLDVVSSISADTLTHALILDSDQADTKCVYIEDPTAADDLKSLWFNGTANDFQVTEIWAESDQTVTFMLQLDDGTPADCDTVDLAPAAGTAEDTSLDGDCLVAAGERLDLDVASVASTPTWVSICFTGNWVD